MAGLALRLLSRNSCASVGKEEHQISCPSSAWKLSILRVLRRLLKGKRKRGMEGISRGPSGAAQALSGVVPIELVGEQALYSHGVSLWGRGFHRREPLSLSRTTFVLRDNSLLNYRIISLLLN